MPVTFSSREARQPFASFRESSKRLFFTRRKVGTGVAVSLAVAVAYHVVFGANGLTVYEQKRHETQTLRVQLDQLREENELLKGRVGRLQSDPEAIEQQAREELHYTRPDEVIYALPTAPTTDLQAASPPSAR